ncbi:MFS transporter [Streptomyces bathyalis]|uniref:MFS transporter n=1 Tax=Streptomyces bathyalis TaxID=2710756 RepID=A0A7T1T3P3_9ACTN|nr:MFS transporter [Streptomyces bathyalis]QPP05837.1 MFS transporter [Streptomyces bathyalis]
MGRADRVRRGRRSGDSRRTAADAPDHGQSDEAALAATPRTVAYLLVGLLAGPLADRWDSRKVLIGCDAGRTVLFAAMPLTVHAAHGAVLLFTLACLAAALGVLFETSLAKAVQSTLRTDELVTGNSRLELSSQLGLLLGPAVTGALVALIGVDRAVWLNAATFAASIGTLLPLRHLGGRRRADAAVVGTSDAAASPSAPARRSGTGSLWREMKEGMGYLRAHPLISRLILVQAAVNFVIAAETLIVFQTTVGLGASPTWAGVVLAAAGVGGVLAAWLAGRFTQETARPGALIGWSVIGVGGTLLGFALSVHPVLLLIANLLHGGLSIFASIHIRALRQKLVPAEFLGRVTANARTAAFVANPLGAVLFGAIADRSGGDARWSFALAALLSLVSGALAYRGLVARRNVGSELPARGHGPTGDQERNTGRIPGERADERAT